MNREDKNPRQEEEEATFGFEKVSSTQKRTLVDAVFSDVAGKYDVMNDLMSLGLHRLWKDEFCKMVPNLESTIIDVAGGTGDIAFRLSKRARRQNKTPYIVVCDINYEMLKICQDRATDKNILKNLELVTADAEQLPFASSSFDYYTIAFGIRNVVSIENTLKEAYRILKPGGKFLCLEFSKIENEYIKSLYNFYSFNIIPNIGKLVTGNRQAYQYLAESISVFPDQEELRATIQNAGFQNVDYRNLGLGVAAIHYGYKI